MIEVEMNDDVRKTETKMFGRFTLRQIVCILISSTYAVPIAIKIPTDISLKIVIGVILAAPVIFCGWIKLNKEPFEIVAIRYVYKHFLTPSFRKVKRENAYKKTYKKIKAEEERKKMSSGKKKSHKKEKNKGLVYSKKKEYKIYT